METDDGSLLWKRFAQMAAEHPERTVFIEADADRSLTATDLRRCATEMAESMVGVRPGSRVVFSIPNSVAWIALFLALQKKRAIAIPLDPTLPLEALPVAGTDLRAHFYWRDEILHSLPAPSPRRTDRVLAKVTSGSTGAPKAISCTAENLLADGENIISTMGIRADDRNLALVPFGHSYGLGNLIMPLLLQGTSVVCAPRFVPRQIFAWSRNHAVTILPGVPALFRLLGELPDESFGPSVRLAISAGAPLDAPSARVFFERHLIKIHNFYGSSETGGICYDRTGDAAMAGTGIGTPLVQVQVDLNRASRVTVASRAVATGRRVEGGMRRFTLRDRARWNADGLLQMIGRIGEIANIGGKKVHPSEVDTALRRVTGVTDAWVVVREDSSGRQYLAAVVETARNGREVETDLAKFLPDWKLPRRVIYKPSLPRTDRGKLATPELRGMIGE